MYYYYHQDTFIKPNPATVVDVKFDRQPMHGQETIIKIEGYYPTQGDPVQVSTKISDLLQNIKITLWRKRNEAERRQSQFQVDVNLVFPNSGVWRLNCNNLERSIVVL